MHTAGAECEITAETYRRLHRRLYARILRQGVPPAEVEDLIQETFMHAQQALDRGRFEGRSDLDTWILSIAKIRTLKFHRRRRAAKRRVTLVALDDPDDREQSASPEPASRQPDPQAHAADRQLLSRTILALDELPEPFRAPLVLSVHGHSYQQIAALLGIPTSRVTSRIHQARAKLRKALAAPTHGPAS
jgi:RNA polymerase sigma-70 factor (ECF subfamily)